MEIEKSSDQPQYQARHLNDETKWGIVISIKYYHQTYKIIENMFGVGSGTISKIWKKYNTQGSVDNNFEGNQNARKLFSEEESRVQWVLNDLQRQKFSLLSSNLQKNQLQSEGGRFPVLAMLEQAVSIATINKNAERNYKKELKQLKQIDDDPTHSLNLKVNAFNKYYDKLIKTDTKSDAAKKYQSNKLSQQKINQKSNLNQNQNQSERMDVEYMKTNKNNNQKKNNQQKSPHNSNQVNNNKNAMDEEINFEKKEIKTILKNNNNNTNSEQNKKVQKQNHNHENLNKNQNEIPQYKVSLKSRQTAQEYTNQNESDELQDDQTKIKVAKLYKQVAHHLDPIELNELAKQAKENETFPDDTQHRLVSKNLELNQMWDSRLIQMFTNEPYQIQQMLDSAKIQSRDLRKKIKYDIYINEYLLYILKQNFGRQKCEVEERIYHNIALLMLIPIIKLLKSQQVIDKSDKVNTQGLMEVLYQAYSQGQKKAYKVNHIIQINTYQEKPVLVILNITKLDAKEFE